MKRINTRVKKRIGLVALAAAALSAVGGLGAADHAWAAEGADLEVTVDAPRFAQPGDIVTYHVTVTNKGPSIATSVSLTDRLPTETSFLSITQVSGVPFSCTPPAGASGSLVCTAPALGPLEAAEMDISMQLGPSATGTTVANELRVASPTYDPWMPNNSAVAFVTVEGSADLSLTMTAPPGALPGGVAAYTITVTNAGPLGTAPVGITSTVPVGTTFAYSYQTAGPLFTCDNDATIVFCHTGRLQNGESATLTFVFAVPRDTPLGTAIENGVSVSAGYPADPDLSNNAAISATTVVNCKDGWRDVTDNDNVPFRSLGDCQRFLRGGGYQR